MNHHNRCFIASLHSTPNSPFIFFNCILLLPLSVVKSECHTNTHKLKVIGAIDVVHCLQVGVIKIFNSNVKLKRVIPHNSHANQCTSRCQGW